MLEEKALYYMPPRYEALCVCGQREDITESGRISDVFLAEHAGHRTPDIEKPIDLRIVYPAHRAEREIYV